MFNITFYNYSGLPNAINKTLENGTTIACNFNIGYNEIHPKIKIVADNFNYNYCFIESTGKYYFIDSVTITRNQFYELELTEDVLQTYKDYLLTLYGTVIESKTPYYLKGANFPVYSQYNMKKYEFEKTPYNKDGGIILISVGSV